MPLSAGKPASASFIAAICSCSSAGSAVCSRIGSMMFCATDSEENSAPCWNSTPMSDAFSAAPMDCDRLAVEEHFAGIRLVQADERLEQHRLARSRAAGDADDFAGQDVEARACRAPPACRTG